MKKCSNCGAQIADGDRFCAKCGGKYVQDNICPNCGTLINEGEAFCSNCGRRLSNSDFIIKMNATTTSEAKNKHKNRILLPLIIGIIALTIICIGLFYFPSDRTKSQEPFFVATDNIVFERQSKSDQIGMDDFYHFYASLEYPKGKGNPLLDNIKLWIKNTIFYNTLEDKKIKYNGKLEEVEAIINSLFQYYKKSKDGCSHCIYVEKLYENNSIVTFESTNMYSGGNSGFYKSEIASFDKTSGKKIELSQISEKSIPQVKDLIWDQRDKDSFTYQDIDKLKGFTFGFDRKNMIIVYSDITRFPGGATINIPIDEAQTNILKKEFDPYQIIIK